jgi:hypothetical protein
VSFVEAYQFHKSKQFMILSQKQTSKAPLKNQSKLSNRLG